MPKVKCTTCQNQFECWNVLTVTISSPLGVVGSVVACQNCVLERAKQAGKAIESMAEAVRRDWEQLTAEHRRQHKAPLN